MENCFRVREATKDDKQAVLEIIVNAYEGLDTLPEYYDYFQNNKHITSYVYTENEKIIAYVACFRIDNGNTMLSRTGRVSPEYQGKHVYRRFISEVEDLQKDTSNGLPFHHTLLKSILPQERFLRSYKPVATKEMHMFEYSRTKVSRKLKLITSGHRGNAKVTDNIPTDFLSPPYSNYLFPEGRVIVDWVAFRLLPTNIPLFKGRNTVFCSDIRRAAETNSPNALRKNNENLTNQETTNKFACALHGLLSAGTTFKAHNDLDLSCLVDIFGTDYSSLKDHIFLHLQRVEDIGLENINLMVCTTKESGASSLLDEVLDPLEIKRVKSGSRKHYVEQVVYEKEIK